MKYFFFFFFVRSNENNSYEPNLNTPSFINPPYSLLNKPSITVDQVEKIQNSTESSIGYKKFDNFRIFIQSCFLQCGLMNLYIRNYIIINLLKNNFYAYFRKNQFAKAIFTRK